MLEELPRGIHDLPRVALEHSDDPLGDEDLQLSLYLCYELHYRGLPGVAESSSMALNAVGSVKFLPPVCVGSSLKTGEHAVTISYEFQLALDRNMVINSLLPTEQRFLPAAKMAEKMPAPAKK